MPDERTDVGFWDGLRGKMKSRKGGWIIGEAVYNCGYSMMDDLVGHASFFQVLVLNVTGRMPEKRLADWLEATFICLSWPDPRIWCNQIGSLTGTLSGSCVAGAAAGILAADSARYGSAPLLYGVRFIADAMEKHRNGMTAEEIVEGYPRLRGATPMIVGYVRPIASGDDRVPAIDRVTKSLGYEIGEHLALAFEIDNAMQQKYGESMNINGFVSAFLSDQGYSAEEVYRIASCCVNGGIHACYADAADSPPESFFPLRCEDIDYQGKPPRPVP